MKHTTYECMTERNNSSKSENGNSSKSEDGLYSKIKVPDANDSYLETTSGKNDNAENIWQRQQTCSKCGLTARNKQELQDHIDHAHSGSATKSNEE